jgi:hypothetical protein
MIRAFKTNSPFSIPSVLFFFCCLQVCAQTIQDPSYFPLAMGNQWIYRTIDSLDTETTAVGDTQRVKGNLYYGLSYVSGYPLYIWLRNENDKVYIVDTLSNRLDVLKVEEYLLYDFSADTLQYWEVPLSASDLQCNYSGRITMASKNAVVFTPAGTYLNCIHLDHPYPHCMDAGLWGEWFAPGVGRVAYVEDNFAGERNYILINSIILTSTPGKNISPVIDSYHLEQNYPNPFNSTTTIVFQIPQKSHVILDIFNTVGQRVKTLVDTELLAGQYSVFWNAFNQPSGVYFCKISVNHFSKSIKLMLIR